MSERPRILFCSYDFQGAVGGPLVWARRLLPALSSAGIDAQLAAFSIPTKDPAAPTELVRFAMNAGLPVHTTRLERNTPSNVRWVETLCERLQPRVVVANHVLPAVYAGAGLRRCGIPTVITLHSDDRFYHDLLALCTRIAPRFAPSVFVAVSHYLETLARAAAGGRSEVVRIPYGVPIPERLATHGDSFVLLYAGRLVDEHKRICDVAKALAVAAGAVPGVSARICGDGPRRGLHLKESGLEVDYRMSTAEQFSEEKAGGFDVVTCLELLEHVPDPASVGRACSALVTTGGDVFFATLNRNLKSFLFAIIGAEYVLRLVKKGTHSYRRFIKPSELEGWGGASRLAILDITDLHYNPFRKTYSLGGNTHVNYLMHFRKQA